MFSKFFKRPSAVQAIQQAPDEIEFVEQLAGSGLDALRMELAPRLMRFDGIENAYLPKLQYRCEDKPRSCLLLVERAPLAAQRKEEIAAACAGIIPMDICFSLDLPNDLVSKVTALCRPLLLPELALFECPLVVKPGPQSSMPAEWSMGVSFWFVAAASYEDALVHAVASARAAGFEFVDVYQGQVLQIDHTKWWDEIVMKQWREYSEHLPTQQQIDVAVATGGAFQGPTVGPIALGSPR
ncbi:hypothetical protein I7X39_20285 [Inhella sp. 1Y17]|uniref:Uncharacterized protein n=2 Tax=Inhella proteolytica TaxID=2795029 RepID=A0A931JAW2_9BURK|nr:hypothetical protein [Inhella proteolytica]